MTISVPVLIQQVNSLESELAETRRIWINLNQQTVEAMVLAGDVARLENELFDLYSQVESKYGFSLEKQKKEISNLGFQSQSQSDCSNADELAQSSPSSVVLHGATTYSQTLLEGVYDVVASGVAKVKAKFSKRVNSSPPPVQTTIFDLIDRLIFSFQSRLEYLKLLFQNFHNPVGRGMAVPDSDAEWGFVERRAREIQGQIDFIEDWLFEFSWVLL